MAAVERAYQELPPRWAADSEDRIFALLFDVFRHQLHYAAEFPAIKPTVAQVAAQPDALTFGMPDHDPDHPVFATDEILDADEEVPELEALTRWAMVLRNPYPRDGSRTTLHHAADIGPDDFVVTFHPRDREVLVARVCARPPSSRHRPSPHGCKSAARPARAPAFRSRAGDGSGWPGPLAHVGARRHGGHVGEVNRQVDGCSARGPAWGL